MSPPKSCGTLSFFQTDSHNEIIWKICQNILYLDDQQTKLFMVLKMIYLITLRIDNIYLNLLFILQSKIFDFFPAEIFVLEMNFGSSVAKAFDFLDVSVGNSCCFSPPLPRIFLRAFPTGLHYNTFVFVAGFTVDIIVVVSSVVVAAFGRLLPW